MTKQTNPTAAQYCILDEADHDFSLCTTGGDAHNFSAKEAERTLREWLSPARKLFIGRVSPAVLSFMIHSSLTPKRRIFRERIIGKNWDGSFVTEKTA